MSNDILEDIIPKETIILIIGESVGPESAKNGHYYSKPTNKFWELLSYLTGKKLKPEEDKTLLQYKIGLTDIIKDKILLNGVELNKIDEYFDNLTEKIESCKPKIIVFNGKFKGGKTKEAKQVRRNLEKRYEKFYNKYKNKFIIFQCPSSSARVQGSSIDERKKIWLEIAEEYKKHIA